MANSNGFDKIFAAIASQNEEMISVNAEIVLLGERVKVLEEGQATGGSGSADGGEEEEERMAGAPVCWDDLSAVQRAKLWPEFVAWVIWLADRKELTNDQLPRQCWWKHGAVVDELTALWTSHESAYASGEDAGSAPYLWQDALDRGIERIGRRWLGTCRNGQHRDRHRSAWANDAAYLAELLAAVTTDCHQTPGDKRESTATPSGNEGEVSASEPPEDPTDDDTRFDDQ
ncbi:hypothetical protein [Streptomyces sp. NEAU-174]|uniref:hypothetical protein n=1 Tax=Streptomyces sp. NEAU-174 TaxID=3458254 RepID=UPI004044B3B0